MGSADSLAHEFSSRRNLGQSEIGDKEQERLQRMKERQQRIEQLKRELSQEDVHEIEKEQHKYLLKQKLIIENSNSLSKSQTLKRPSTN